MSEETTRRQTDGEGEASERTVVACNFRSAGRLSNESTRHLRTVHEAFARNVSHSLDLFLGSALDVKLIAVEQVDSRAFITSLTASSYLVPFTITPMQARMIVRLGSTLLFPLLDLLLGGNGDPDDQARELTEIDEELIRSVTELIGIQLERAWKACQVSLTPTASIKPALVGQIFALEERVTVVRFEMTAGTTTGALEVVLPMAFTNALIRASQTEATRRVARQAAPATRLRDRLLDCRMTASAELAGLRLLVGDLVGLQPGHVIPLHAPVATPVRLMVSGRAMFEINPVRHGSHKAAQLGMPCGKDGGDAA